MSSRLEVGDLAATLSMAALCALGGCGPGGGGGGGTTSDAGPTDTTAPDGEMQDTAEPGMPDTDDMADTDDVADTDDMPDTEVVDTSDGGDGGGSCVYDPDEADQIDTNDSHASGVCTDQELTESGTCSQPDDFEARTDDESNCNQVDNDCDGTTDEGCPCEYDGSSEGVCSTTKNADGMCPEPGNFEDPETSCDSNDNDCDGWTDEFVSSNCAQFKNFGTQAEDKASDVLVDDSGNMYVLGNSIGDIGGNTNPQGTLRPDFLARFDPEGANKWYKFLSTDVNFNDFTIDDSGKIYMVGATDQNIAGNMNAGNNDVFIAQYDSSGNRQWVELLGTPEEDVGEVIALTQSGELYVGGRTSGDFDNGKMGQDGFVANYDTSGNFDWSTNVASDESDEVDAIAASGNGVFVGGDTEGDLGGAFVNGFSEGFVVAYGSSGNVQWDDHIGSQLGNVGEGVVTIAAASSGEVHAVGSTKGEPGMTSNQGGRDIYLRTYDSSGNIQRTKLFGSSDDDFRKDTVTDSSGNPYILGYTTGSDGVFSGTTPNGDNDGFVIKVGSSGGVAGLERFGTGASDVPTGIATGVAGTVLVGGVTGGSLGGSNAGSKDGFIGAVTP